MENPTQLQQTSSPDPIVLKEDVIEIDDIQGDPLFGFNKPFNCIITFDIKQHKESEFKTFMKTHLASITTGRDIVGFREHFRRIRAKLNLKRIAPEVLKAEGLNPQVCLNVGFSYEVLTRLAPSKNVDKFDYGNSAYSLGLPARSPGLADGDRSNWVVGKDKNPEVALWTASDSEQQLEEFIKLLEKELGDFAQHVYVQRAPRRSDNPNSQDKEHYGFNDGLGQPGLRGVYKGKDGHLHELTQRRLSPVDPDYNTYGYNGQQLVYPGEIFLGYADNYSGTGQNNLTVPYTRLAPEWAKNGTFMVYRRMKQDVAKFWNFLKSESEKITKETGVTMTDDHLGAKCVGRWTSGAPIERTPDKDNLTLALDLDCRNAFQFSNDYPAHKLKPGIQDNYPQQKADIVGLVCPFSGHLRKVNPRDTPTDTVEKTINKRIMRRGTPYGPPIKDKYHDDGVDRGLVFISYQANIENQFEFLLHTWVNNPAGPQDGGEDLIIGQKPDGKRHFNVPLINSKNELVVHTMNLTKENVWTTVTGGGYFFFPSISAIKNVIVV